MTSAIPVQPEQAISFDDLRQKWQELPSGVGSRCRADDLLNMSDHELREFWRGQLEEYTTGPAGFATRGWYHTLYLPHLRGKRILDVGAGLGFDGITYALAGAEVTFIDIAPANLDVLQRLCDIFDIEQARFLYLEDVDSLAQLQGLYDVVWAQGSLIHAPYQTACRERSLLLDHLALGGRWIELTYPKSRWTRDGCLPFEQWGEITDGKGTPWAEWYDLTKLRSALQPATFDVVLSLEFADGQFHWFDLLRRG